LLQAGRDLLIRDDGRKANVSQIKTLFVRSALDATIVLQVICLFQFFVMKSCTSLQFVYKALKIAMF